MGNEKCHDGCNVDLDIFEIIKRNVTVIIERTSLASRCVVCIIVCSEDCDIVLNVLLSEIWYGVSKL